MFPYCLPGVPAAATQVCLRAIKAMPPFYGDRPALSDFEARYDRISGDRTDARKARRPKPRNPDREIDPRTQAIIDDRAYLRSLKDLRLTHGFAYPGGQLGSEWIPPFCETGMRSKILGLTAKRFVAATAKRVETGRTKAGIAAGTSKLLGLDDAYVRLNRDVIGGFRVDLDARFASFEALCHAVSDCGLPALPHLVVARKDATGTLHNPHLWYLLPDTGAVWIRGHAKVVALLHRVIAGVTQALAPAGADPGGLANPFHGKNPLSPLFSTQAWNETRYPTLADWARSIDLTAKDQHTFAGAAKRGEILAQSNHRARTLFRWAVEALRQAHCDGDPSYRSACGDPGGLGRYLCDRLARDAVIHLNWDDAATLARQCQRIAARWDPDKLAKSKRRGALRADVDGCATLRERQQIAQQRTAQTRRKRSTAQIAEAIAACRRQRQPFTQSAVARNTGLARSTVARHWADALRSPLSRLVIRKKGKISKGLKPGAAGSSNTPCDPNRSLSSPPLQSPPHHDRWDIAASDTLAPHEHRADRITDPTPTDTNPSNPRPERDPPRDPHDPRAPDHPPDHGLRDRPRGGGTTGPSRPGEVPAPLSLDDHHRP